MPSSTIRKALFTLAFVPTVAFAQKASGPAPSPAPVSPIAFVLEGGFEFGGDEVLELLFTNGDTQKLTAGQGGTIAAGLQFHPASVPRLSIAGTIGYKFVTNASENANVGITRVVAQEWARFGVNVNAVAPGFTETRMTAAKKPGDVLGVPEEQRQATLSRIPMGRFGRPQDIANAVLFFSSPLSDYITGQTINVSGGMQIP